MVDTPDLVPDGGSQSEEDAHKARMAELFGDLDEDEETPESIKAERDSLRTKLANIGAAFGKSQQDNLSLTKQLAAQKEESARAGARVKQQFEEQKSFMMEKFVKEILPVVDTLELGLKSVSAAQRAADPKFDRHLQGVEKTIAQLTAVFNKFGIQTINPAGEAFDPGKHEAIGMSDEASDQDADTVLHVAQKGYELNGRVIRPARVIVKP